jgi:hypothetical protein
MLSMNITNYNSRLGLTLSYLTNSYPGPCPRPFLGFFIGFSFDSKIHVFEGRFAVNDY